MLSDIEYAALQPFRNAEPVDRELSDIEQQLLTRGLIASSDLKSQAYDGVIQFYESGWIITTTGFIELELFEKHRSESSSGINKLADELANQTAIYQRIENEYKTQAALDKRQLLKHDIILVLVTSVVDISGTLLIAYWHEVISFLKGLF